MRVWRSFFIKKRFFYLYPFLSLLLFFIFFWVQQQQKKGLVFFFIRIEAKPIDILSPLLSLFFFPSLSLSFFSILLHLSTIIIIIYPCFPSPQKPFFSLIEKIDSSLPLRFLITSSNIYTISLLFSL